LLHSSRAAGQTTPSEITNQPRAIKQSDPHRPASRPPLSTQVHRFKLNPFKLSTFRIFVIKSITKTRNQISSRPPQWPPSHAFHLSRIRHSLTDFRITKSKKPCISENAPHGALHFIRRRENKWHNTHRMVRLRGEWREGREGEFVERRYSPDGLECCIDLTKSAEPISKTMIYIGGLDKVSGTEEA